MRRPCACVCSEQTTNIEIKRASGQFKGWGEQGVGSVERQCRELGEQPANVENMVNSQPV